MKRLLIIGESLPLPAEELMYDDTWIYLLTKSTNELEIVDKCVRARSVRTLNHGGPKGEAKNLFEWYNPDIILLHLGLTDCAPRLIRHGSRVEWIINHSPFAEYIYKLLRKYRGRRLEYADVPEAEFRENLEQYCKKVFPIPVGIVNISEVTCQALKKSPLFNIQIRRYNQIISDIAKIYNNVSVINSFDGQDPSLYQSDGMHFSAKGQLIIFNKISKYLCNCLNINILPPPTTCLHPRFRGIGLTDKRGITLILNTRTSLNLYSVDFTQFSYEKVAA